MASAGCNPFVSPGTHYGSVVFHALDLENDRVPGVRFSVELEQEPTPMVVVTGEDGIAELAREEGEWSVTVTPPEGYSVAPTQSSRFTIRIRRSRTIEIVTRLEDETPEF